MELTPDHPECFVPQFTPDGRTIVFIRRDGDVYRIDVDGRNLHRLTQSNRHVEFKLSTKGGEPRQLTWLQGAAYFVNWKPEKKAP